MTTISSPAYYTISNRYPPSQKSDASDIATEQPHKGAPTNGTEEKSPRQPSIDSLPSKASINFQGVLFSSTRLENAIPINISELSEEEYRNFVESDERAIEANRNYLEREYSNDDEIPDMSKYSDIKLYATVNVGGAIVAKIDNQGGVETTDEALGKSLMSLLISDVNGTNGPNLAQARAEQISKLLGGRIVKADTALTQLKFSVLSNTNQAERVVNYEAMKQDPIYQHTQNLLENLEKIKQQRQYFPSRR
ncbi:hypothetical protein [Agrobacterium tumefaciens]|jgi:hypothetical protein|uniref:hypothetical protein n=1 Tax=Agrobacterium tumefaciens TaxID=358 RepID=UPI000DD8D6D0|nr:hypothetical protein [Agrobacterium tumefaciens]MDR6590838.1 hypothetical protein [Agrobacterium tumefaciens]